MKNNLKNSSGQALVETLLVIVSITVVCFAMIEFCVIVMDDLICNEVAFSIVRTAVVTKIGAGADNNSDREASALRQTTLPAAGLLLLTSGLVNLKNLNFIPTAAETEVGFLNDGNGGRLKDNSERDIRLYNTTMKYYVNTMFIRLIDPFGTNSFSFNGHGMLQRFARARMVKSPDEEYYDHAYRDASKFNY